MSMNHKYAVRHFGCSILPSRCSPASIIPPAILEPRAAAKNMGEPPIRQNHPDLPPPVHKGDRSWITERDLLSGPLNLGPAPAVLSVHASTHHGPAVGHPHV